MRESIALASTEELLEALYARCDALVVALQHQEGGKRAVNRYFYRGGYATCLGLLTRFQRDMLAEDAEGDALTDGEWQE